MIGHFNCLNCRSNAAEWGRLVVSEGARLIMLSVLIGIPGIYMSGEALKGFLIEVSPFDRPTLQPA